MKITLVLLVMVLVTTYGQNQNVCECSELILQTECQFAGCQWETNSQTLVSQCINKFPINMITCSDYDDQLTCDFLQGCAWTQDEKCAPFTQCSDYMIDSKDNADQCYLKDQSCIQGQLNINGYIKCSTIEDACKDESQNDQFFQSSDSTKLALDLNHYASTIDFRLTNILNCVSQKKAQKQCSQITNQVICSFLRNDENVTLCQWNNNSCIEIPQVPKLNQRNCYLNTGGTYSWKQNSCQICQGLQKQISSENNKQKSTLSLITNLKTTSESQQNITENPELLKQTNCNRTFESTISQNCFSTQCQQQIKSTEDIICSTLINEQTRIDISTSTNCEAKTESIKELDGNQNQNSKTSIECNADISNSTFINDNIVSKIIITSNSQNQCNSHSNQNQEFNSKNQCNQTINTISKTQVDQNLEVNHIETNCYSNSNALSDQILDQIQVISNSECIIITDNDQKNMIKINTLLDESKQNENSIINTKISEINGDNVIITNCNTNGEEEERVRSEKFDEINQQVSSFQKTDCLSIINNDQANSLPSSFYIENVIESKIQSFNYTFLLDSHPAKVEQQNNCTNGSNCSINVVKSNTMILAIAMLLMLNW